MIKAMERIERPTRLLVFIVGSCILFLDMGCAGMSGFRSVGTERPSLLGFRNSSQAPSPPPAGDLYALNMAGERKPSEGSKQTELGSARAQDDKVATRPAGELTTVMGPENPSAEKPSARETETEKSIRVTLGRPEPLAGRSKTGTQIAALATEPSTPRWKTDTNRSLASHPNDALALPVDGKAVVGSMPGLVVVNTGRDAVAMDSKAILDRAEDRLKGMNTYQVKISRIERVGGQLQPEEDIVLSIQRDPKAVRLEWVEGPNKGREVIYSSKLDPRMLFVHIPSSAIALPTMKVAVDSPMVMRNSRHAITEAGFDTIIDNLRKEQGAGPTGASTPDALEYKGLETASGIDSPSHHFVRRTRSDEIWDVYLDSKTLLPRLVSAKDAKGDLIERYIYREVRVDPADLLTASAFSPDQRWGESNGLLSRLARAAAGTSQPTTSQSTTR